VFTNFRRISPMRRALIGKDRAAFIGARRPFHQQRRLPDQPVNLIGLCRHDVRKLIHRADQMGHPLLQGLYPVAHVYPSLAARSPIRYTARQQASKGFPNGQG
jgi:hypothetical protein